MAIKKFRFSLIFPILLLLFSTSPSFAASGSMTLIPDSGTHASGSILNESLKIDGGGTPFNAAKASLLFSPQVSIKDLLIGDCGFSFIKTPTVSDPSFVGVLLGSSTSSCTVYTLTFQVAVPGTQKVTIQDASIKSYQGAEELYQTSKNAVFTVTGNQDSQGSIASLPELSPTEPPAIVNGTKYYSVTYTVPILDSQKKSHILVKLDSSGPTQTTVSSTVGSYTPFVLSAEFKSVPEGVHTLTVYSGGKKVSEQVITVNGPDKNLAFGNTPASTGIQPFTAMWYVLVGLGAIGVILILVLGVRVYFYVKEKMSASKLPS